MSNEPDAAAGGVPEDLQEHVTQWIPADVPVSTERFGPEILAILNEPIDVSQISVKPDRGELYMTHIWYRDRFNRAFGQGGWVVRPASPWVERGGEIVRDWELIVAGRWITECTSGHGLEDWGTLSDAREACRSNSYPRLGKDLGIAKELWDRQFVERFVREYVVRVCVRRRRKKKNSNEYEWVFVKAHRRKDLAPLEGEVGPWKENANGFYPDDAPRVPLDDTRFAAYGAASGPPAGAGAPPAQTPGKAPEAPSGPPSAKSGGPAPAPAPDQPAGLSDDQRQQLTKANQRFLYDKLAARWGTQPKPLGDALSTMTALVLNLKIRSFAQLNYEQSKKLREAIEEKKFDVKTMSLSA